MLRIRIRSHPCQFGKFSILLVGTIRIRPIPENIRTQTYSTPTRCPYIYEGTPPRNSYTYGVPLHLWRTPTSSMNRYAYKVRLHLRGSATTTRYRYICKAPLHLRGAAPINLRGRPALTRYSYTFKVRYSFSFERLYSFTYYVRLYPRAM